MASFLDNIPGYWETVARETVGRDAAYLRLPRLVAGVALRPLTLRDYLRLSAENSPFVAGGKANRDDVCFLLWHQQIEVEPGETPQSFAVRFDLLDLDFLSASCGTYVSQAMVDAPGGGGGRRASYYGLGASIMSTFRHEYPGCSREEILDTPLDELFQEMRAIQQRIDPRAILFNRSDRLKGEHARRRSIELERAAQAKARKTRKRVRR